MESVAHQQSLKKWVIVLTAALAAACGKSSTEGPRPEGGPQPAAANATAPEAKPANSPPKTAPEENARGIVTLDPEPTRAPGEADAAFKARHDVWKRASAKMLVDRLRELDVGTTVGKRIEVSPIKYRCGLFDSGGLIEWAPELTKAKCTCLQCKWKEVEPARYDYVQGHTPDEDARLLKDAAEVLGRLGDVVQKPDVQAVKARVLAVAEKVGELSFLVGEAKKTEARIAELKASRKEITGIRGLVVASHGDGLYEVAPLQMVSAYRTGYGKHALLHMTSKEFTSKGNFSLWVKQTGQKEIKTTDGFTDTWNVYEDAEGEAKALDTEIQEKTRFRASVREHQQRLGSLDKDRKAVGEAIQRVIAQYAQATATVAK